MRNIKLTLEYDGTNYCGWQVQSRNNQRKISIQEVLEKTLSRIIREKIHLIASGRTDAGVHARAQVANFKTDSIFTSSKLRAAMNALLPDDIVVVNIEEVASDFHSRFDAKSKIYRYTILNRDCRSPLIRKEVYFYPYPLNIKLMRRESRLLLGRQNFKAFQARDKKERNPVKTIKKVRITKEKDLIYVDIEADGFLYNMMRNIVGTLLEIGRGRFLQGRLRKIMVSRDRRLAGPTLPSRGLCLLAVKY